MVEIIVGVVCRFSIAHFDVGFSYFGYDLGLLLLLHRMGDVGRCVGGLEVGFRVPEVVMMLARLDNNLLAFSCFRLKGLIFGFRRHTVEAESEMVGSQIHLGFLRQLCFLSGFVIVGELLYRIIGSLILS